MSIRPLLDGAGVFSPRDIVVLTSAFEDSLLALGLVDRSDPIVMLVAKHIIEMASTGDRNPVRLRNNVVSRFKSRWAGAS
jgi:hypothetical protein